MRKLPLIVLTVMLACMLMIGMSLSMTFGVQAQDVDNDDTTPFIITPGVSLSNQLNEVVPTLPFTDSSCYQPLALEIGNTIYIEPGVNIRSAPSGSAPIVWNTAYNQIDEEGDPLDEEFLFDIEAFIIGGPVCSLGYNWWQIDFPGGNDGWVAEGRPVEGFGYLIGAPGVTFDEEPCRPQFDLAIGEVAVITQNVRVRTDPTTNSQVRTVAPVNSDVLVLEGPVCSPEGAWFRVQVEVVDFVYDGWMIQGSGGAVWLIPTDLPSEEAGTLCGIPLNFSMGQRGFVDTPDGEPRFLREGPGRQFAIDYMLVDGVPFEIMGGPACSDNLNWWQIRVLSSNPVTGWIAEGSSRAGYWLDD